MSVLKTELNFNGKKLVTALLSMFIFEIVVEMESLSHFNLCGNSKFFIILLSPQ